MEQHGPGHQRWGEAWVWSQRRISELKSPFSVPVGSLLVETRVVAVKVCRESRVWRFSATADPHPGPCCVFWPVPWQHWFPVPVMKQRDGGAFYAPHFTLALSESPPDLQIH